MWAAVGAIVWMISSSSIAVSQFIHPQILICYEARMIVVAQDDLHVRNHSQENVFSVVPCCLHSM